MIFTVGQGLGGWGWGRGYSWASSFHVRDRLRPAARWGRSQSDDRPESNPGMFLSGTPGLFWYAGRRTVTLGRRTLVRRIPASSMNTFI